MKKIIYTLEQIQKVSALLNTITVTGFNGARTMVTIQDLLDSPLSVEEETEDGEEICKD